MVKLTINQLNIMCSGLIKIRHENYSI